MQSWVSYCINVFFSHTHTAKLTALNVSFIKSARGTFKWKWMASRSNRKQIQTNQYLFLSSSCWSLVKFELTSRLLFTTPWLFVYSQLICWWTRRSMLTSLKMLLTQSAFTPFDRRSKRTLLKILFNCFFIPQAKSWKSKKIN